jgi:hypothetical protein
VAALYKPARKHVNDALDATIKHRRHRNLRIHGNRDAQDL